MPKGVCGVESAFGLLFMRTAGFAEVHTHKKTSVVLTTEVFLLILKLRRAYLMFNFSLIRAALPVSERK